MAKQRKQAVLDMRGAARRAGGFGGGVEVESSNSASPKNNVRYVPARDFRGEDTQRGHSDGETLRRGGETVVQHVGDNGGAQTRGRKRWTGDPQDPRSIMGVEGGGDKRKTFREDFILEENTRFSSYY
jgi:hypothetical protein